MDTSKMPVGLTTPRRPRLSTKPDVRLSFFLSMYRDDNVYFLFKLTVIWPSAKNAVFSVDVMAKW